MCVAAISIYTKKRHFGSFLRHRADQGSNYIAPVWIFNNRICQLASLRYYICVAAPSLICTCLIQGLYKLEKSMSKCSPLPTSLLVYLKKNYNLQRIIIFIKSTCAINIGFGWINRTCPKKGFELYYFHIANPIIAMLKIHLK